LEILPYDDDAALHYGRLRAYLEKKGIPIGSLDMLIAAHALSVNCTLVTNNEKEFKRIKNLKINNWAS
jgi:tRNA(fMet)-specific endonuclease VapC